MAEKPRVAIFYGGIPESEDIKTLKSVDSSPHIVVGTPGRIKAVRLRSLHIMFFRLIVMLAPAHSQSD